MRRVAGVVTRCVTAVVVVLVLSPSVASAATSDPGSTASAGVAGYGTSHGGRAIRVSHRCAEGATVDVLVIGAIHGNETAGRAVVRRLVQLAPPPGTCMHLLSALNPDGVAARTRQNARGVDLNRNFPFDWRGGGRAWQTFFPGRARASERETRAALAMIRDIRPDVTVWYHQHATMTIRPPLPWRIALAQAYARTSRLPMREYTLGGRLYGTASSWQHAELPQSVALVVELPAGPLDAGGVRRHANAVRAVATLARFDRADVA